MAYVVTIHGKAGALRVEKCAALGIPPGPLYGELKAGRSIVLDDGTVVRSEDVLDPPQKPMRAIVVECPTEGFIDTVTSNPKLNGDNCENLHFVFHFTPSHIMETEKYSQWMRALSALGPSVRHVALNDRCSGYDSMDLCTFNKSLASIAPSLFNPIKELGDVSGGAEEEIVATAQDLLKMQATNGMRLTLRPEVGVDCSLLSNWTSKAATEQDVLRTAEARAVMAEAHGLMRVDEDRPELPRVTFLGTGSSVPGKYRGVSAILVETKQDHFVLLDCGEGNLSCLWEI
jgi:ribonuclease Z